MAKIHYGVKPDIFKYAPFSMFLSMVSLFHGCISLHIYGKNACLEEDK